MDTHTILLHMAGSSMSLLASLYGLYLLIKKLDIPKDFLLSLFSSDPKSPSTTRFVFILSGVISTFVLWGTWMFCQVANIYYTPSSDIITMVEIPTGVYLTYAIALVGPGGIRLGQSILGKKNPCPPTNISEKKEG